jgi:hypothetical protein
MSSHLDQVYANVESNLFGAAAHHGVHTGGVCRMLRAGVGRRVTTVRYLTESEVSEKDPRACVKSGRMRFVPVCLRMQDKRNATRDCLTDYCERYYR